MKLTQTKFKKLTSDFIFEQIELDATHPYKEQFKIIELLNDTQNTKKILAAGCSCDYQCTCEPHCYCHSDCRCERHCHCHSYKCSCEPHCSCEDDCPLYDHYFCGCSCDNYG